MESEFVSPIKPIRAVRNVAPAPLAQADLRAALFRAIDALDKGGVRAIETALGDLRGAITFYRSAHQLDAKYMSTQSTKKFDVLTERYLSRLTDDERKRWIKKKNKQQEQHSSDLGGYRF